MGILGDELKFLRIELKGVENIDEEKLKYKLICSVGLELLWYFK